MMALELKNSIKKYNKFPLKLAGMTKAKN